jgi:putative transposase
MSGQVSAQQIADAVGVTKRNIQIRAQNESWLHVTDRVRGGRQNLYPILTLPSEVRTQVLTYLAKREKEMAAAMEAGEAIGRRLKLVETIDERAAASARERGLARFMELPEASKRRADARIALVDLCKHYVKVSGLPLRRGRELFCHQYAAGLIEVPAWVREARPSVSPNSIDNWSKALKQEGVARLGGNYGTHRKGTGVINSNPAMLDLVRGMLIEFPHTSAQQVMEAIRARFAKEEHPSYRTLQRCLADWKDEHKQLHTALTNPDAWRSKFKAAVGDAGAEIIRLNQRWEADSTKGDLMLSDGQRHVVVGIIDVDSRRLKLHVSRSSSAAAVASTMRRCLLDWGQPEILGTDNGSDYVSERIERVITGLDIERDLAPPFTPEHKPFIERSFGTFCRGLLELLPGFIGHDVAQRKAIEARKSFATRLMKGGGEPIELRMSPDEFQRFCDDWADKIYAHNDHAGLGGRTPWEVAAAWSQPVRRIADERALDVLLAPAPGGNGIRTIGKKGIKLDNAWFAAPELGGLEGTEVQVRLDDADIGEIYVFDLAGKYLAKAICPERTGVSRKELAVAVKATQKRKMAEEKAAIRAAAKRANISDIAEDIRRTRLEEAGKLVSFPTPTVEHTTDALVEAGRAARASDFATAAELIVEAPAPEPARIIELPRIDLVARERDAKAARFARWKALGASIERGDDVSQVDRRWWESYGRDAECTSRVRAERMVAEGKVAG